MVVGMISIRYNLLDLFRRHVLMRSPKKKENEKSRSTYLDALFQHRLSFAGFKTYGVWNGTRPLERCVFEYMLWFIN